MNSAPAPADPSGYGDALLAARAAINRFEHVAALAASGQPKHLPEAAQLAAAAVSASRSLAAWCLQQKAM